MLYKLKSDGSSTTFVSVKPTTLAAAGYVEKAMEDWLAQNPYAVLPDEARMLVIDQETSFRNLTDILALDERGNVIVIEVKRGQTPRDVVAQALEYASDVATWDDEQLECRTSDYLRRHDASHISLLAAHRQMFEDALDDTVAVKLNERQRILIVGESIEPKIARTARWLQSQGVSIGCISCACYQTDEGELFLDFQEVVAETPEPGGGPISAPRTVPPTDRLRRAAPEVQTIYDELKNTVSSWPGCEMGETSSYLYFRATNNFAELWQQKSRLVVYVRPEGHDLAERQSREIDGLTVESIPDTWQWTLNHKFVLESQSNVPTALRLLQQSYDAVYGSQDRV